MDHGPLQTRLQEEIALRQEILSNLSQQEHVLLIGDLELRRELEGENSTLVIRLKKIIKGRGILTRELFASLPPHFSNKPLEKVLDPFNEAEAETLLLYNQVNALIKKIHEEHLRIKGLRELIQRDGALTISNPALHAETRTSDRGVKPTLITIDYPEEQAE